MFSFSNILSSILNTSKIKAIHVHDNAADTDSHLPPYDGSIDWGDFVEALYDVGYDGIFNLEADVMTKEEIERGMSGEELKERELEIAKIARLLGDSL